MRIEHYLTAGGKDHIHLWLAAMRDVRGKVAIVRRIGRIEKGNFGDHKFCREGVWELRIDSGPGYRVYYGLDGNTLVLLLCGGDKGSQRQDIDNAVAFFNEYMTRKQI